MNLFNFLRENQIFVEVKTKLLAALAEHKADFKKAAKAFVKTKTDAKKSKLIDLIMDKVKLPWFLKPFKSLVRKTIDNNFDKLVDFILEQIEKI